MAVTIDWPTGVITVLQADLTLITGTFYELDTNQFRKDLNALQASEAGMPWPTTHLHNTEVTVGGITYARTFEILAPYSVTFSPDSAWSVRLVGSNNNIWDIEAGILNQNQVQVIPTNSAGLISTPAPGLSGADGTRLQEIHQVYGLDSTTPVTHQKDPAEIQWDGNTIELDEQPNGDVIATRLP